MRKFLCSMVVILAGCATPPREEAPPAAPQEPVQAVAAAPAAPGEAWEVVGSRLEVRVYRDGPMQKLGHNHVITSDRLEGEVILRDPVAATSFLLRVPLDSFVVDDPAARAAAGGDFSTPVPAQDIEGTRRNMLGGKLLDAARHPVMTLTSESISGQPGNYEVAVRVSIAGAENRVTTPFSVTIEGDGLKARASFHLRHADIGIQPFNVALGALKVRDDFEVHLALEARRGS